MYILEKARTYLSLTPREQNGTDMFIFVKIIDPTRDAQGGIVFCEWGHFLESKE